MQHDETHRGDRLPSLNGRGHVHDIREPRDAQLRANLARASIGIEARGPALALAFQTLSPQRAIVDSTEPLASIVAWIVHGSFSCALVYAVLLNLVIW